MPFYSFRYERENVRRISLTLLSIACGFDDMVKKSISGGAGEECLEGIIQTVKDLIAQVDIKVKDAGKRGAQGHWR